MFKTSVVLVSALVCFHRTSSSPLDLKVPRALTTPVESAINKGYGVVTGKSDENRRQEGQTKVKFMLRNWREENWVELSNDKALPSFWVNNGPVKVVVHGWSDMEYEIMYKKDPMQVLNNHAMEVAHAYGNRDGSTNVIIVDWTVLGVDSPGRYSYIVENVPVVGRAIGKFLVGLANKEVKNPKRFHLIGYLMGAHMAGVSGKEFQGSLGKKFGRITGLDPSGAGFYEDDGMTPINIRSVLTKDDAEFVDAIHCSAFANHISVALAQGYYGCKARNGHADFFPNGGIEQPGCKRVNDARPEKHCSAMRCAKYFVSSIDGGRFYGCPCSGLDDYQAGNCACEQAKVGVLMGDACSPGTRGSFYMPIGEDNQGFLSKYVR